MHPIEYQALRKALGLSIEDVARRFNKDRRTAQRWEVHNAPPAVVQAWIQERWADFLDRVDEALQSARELEAEGKGEFLELPVYRSESRCIEETGLTHAGQAALYGHIMLQFDLADLPVLFVDAD